MTDEELNERFKAIQRDIVASAIILMVLIVTGFILTGLTIAHVESILCEQKPVQSCPK